MDGRSTLHLNVAASDWTAAASTVATCNAYWPEIDQIRAEKLSRIECKQSARGGRGGLLPLTPLVPGYACKGFLGWLIIACALFCAVSESATGWRVCFQGSLKFCVLLRMPQPFLSWNNL